MVRRFMGAQRIPAVWHCARTHHSNSQSSTNGKANASGPNGSRTLPMCTTNPDKTDSPRSRRSELIPAAMAGRGVAVDLASIGISLPLSSTRKSTSPPVGVDRSGQTPPFRSL